jgi:membrane protease YdiL (CAAX protease family)
VNGVSPAGRDFVDGRRLLLAIGTSILAAAAVGMASFFLLHVLFGTAGGSTIAQVVTLLVYLTLLIGLCAQFRPVPAPPIALRPTGIRHALMSVAIWVATVAAIILFYYCFGSVFGSVPDVAKRLTGFATDARRLQGQPTAAWILAILRGCLIVPIFEEVFFRGLFLSWLRKHLTKEIAVIVMASVFTLEHGSFIVGPYVFIFAIVTGYVRLRTHSTFNTVIMHILNNVMLLYVGLRIFSGP